MCFRSLKTKIRNFCEDTQGNFTIEAVMWTPIMAGVLMLTADATMLMHSQTALYDAARDASRQVVVGAADEQGAKTSIESTFKSSAYVTADIEISGEYVKTTVSMPFSSVVQFTGALFGNQTLSASTVMWVGAPQEVTS